MRSKMKIWIDKDNRAIIVGGADLVGVFHLGMLVRKVSGHSAWMIFETGAETVLRPLWSNLPSFDADDETGMGAHLKEVSK